ncbi:MAG: LapA family protein [Cryomorphaceae bacterium]
MKRIYSILILCLVVLFAAFIIQNAELVDLTFLIWGIEISKALLMILCAGVGFLIGLLVFSFRKSQKEASDVAPTEKKSEVPPSHSI